MLYKSNKLILYFSFAAVFSVSTAYSQKTDSLKRVLTTAIPDSTRSKVFAQLAYIYQDISPDSAIGYANTGLRAAENVHFARGKGDCLQQLGISEMRRNNLEKSISYFSAAERSYREAAYSYGQVSAILSIADVEYRKGKYDTTISLYQKGKMMADKAGDLRHAGLARQSLGGLYSDLGNYSEALKYSLESARDFEKIGNRENLSMVLTNVATVYSALGEHAKALSYIKKSAELQDPNNKEGILFNVVNTGIVYGEMKDYANALVYFQRGLALADSIGDANWKLMCMNNLAESEYFLNHKDKAFSAYAEVLKLTEKVNDAIIVVSAHSGMGKILVEKGNTKEGIDHLLKAHLLAREKGMKDVLYNTAMELSKAYEKAKDPVTALRYHKLYADYKDSVYNEKSDKRIEQLQYEYELSKKEDRIQLLEKNRQVEQSRSEEQKVILWALSGGVLLLVTISLLLLRSGRREKRSKELILAQKEEITQQAKNLEELNAFKDKTFSVLSHDLRSPISAFTSSMMLVNEGFITPEQFADLRPALTRQINSLNSLLDSLLKWGSVYMQGQAHARPDKTNMYDIVNQNIGLLENDAAQKQITIVNNIPPVTSALCDAGQIDIVIRNLLMNAIKFTGSKGSITISARPENEKTVITLSDTGVGMTPQQVDRFFARVPGNNTPGTAGEKGLGLGLMLCHEFVTANNGTIAVFSQPGQGTTFTITLPAA
jgi:signal transduction histidine kinase